MSEAATGNILSELKAITECSICTETFQDPRILPCIHTFCLECMQQMAKRGDKKPGDKLSCPICRKEITIADDEAMGLQKNFSMARLIEMVMIFKPIDKDPLCNICLLAESEDSSVKIKPATMYCIDCHDNLCSECSMHHRKQKLSRDHKVISLGSEVNEEELLEKSALGFCDEHKKEQQKLFCVDCKMLACALCFVESHRLHDCRNISKVADELRPRIIANISGVSNHVTEMFTQKEQLENETTQFLTIIAELENEILRRNSELKELVDKSTASLLEELSAAKKQRLKEIENKKEDNETHLTILKTFQTYCTGIITKGTDSDVCRVVNDLCCHADELQKLHLSHISQNLPSMKLTFQITKLNPSAKENIIGTISGSPPKSYNEAAFLAERMEYPDANLLDGNEETEEVGDPAWEGFNTMELDTEEDVKEKKKHERSKDDFQERSDKERTLKKGKTGYNSRPEEEKPEARSKFDDQVSTEKFTFFWRADSPFSQHHPANFIIDGVQYNCAEQFMMHQKAVVFKDEKIGWEIMHTNSPAKQKSLAKQVEGFNEAYWKTLRRNVVKTGNIAKFSQNTRLRRMLFATAGTAMVEASPVDNTWGIGVSADDPKAWRRQTWAGGNLLGEIITEVREELMEKYKNIREDEEGWMSCKDFSHGNTGRYDEQYTVFWRPVSPFHLRYPVGFELDNQYYQTLQQYLLHQKALFFNDSATARAIMENFRPNKLDELGRKIRNCDHCLWSRYCRSYLRLGNFAKFSQNPNIGQQLVDNVLNGELVYAVEEDRLLGVGLKEMDGRLYRKKSWKGKNLLGRALMEVRDMLMKNEQTLPEIVKDLEDEVVDELSYGSQEAAERQFQFFFIKSPFNQWHLCRFRIGNIQYNSAEQYMLHQMSLQFHDQQAAENVMHCRHPRDMQNIDIRNYDERDWEKVCKEIVMDGNRAKFTQDYKLREELSKTEDSFLAYASIKDLSLGIGLRDTDPLAYDQQNWPGYNILGEVLMEIREELKQQKNNSNSNNSNRTWQSDSKESIPYPTNDQSAEKFTFFWQKSPFSQWWKCCINIDEYVYNCSEQYMMHQKALYFDDLKTAQEIMKTGNPFDQWQLGRRIQSYSNDKWNAVCQDVVRTGNMAKFSQHPRMRQQLFDTAGTTLVEASPKDCKWGIGVTQDDPRARRRETWLGMNLLGQILTEVRDELMKQENSYPQTYSASNIPGSGTGRDRRGSERSDGSQGHTKNSESDSRGFSHESHQKPRFDHGGAAGKPMWQSEPEENQPLLVDGAVSNENIHVISEKSALSLWHQANFEVDKIKYKSVGQYIAHQKALRFNDGNTADAIMKASSVTRIIKCDKYVDGFDEKKWKRIHRDVIKDGNYYKFSQNEDLKQELLATSGSLLVYADFKDLKLGVGLRSDDRGIRDQKRWKGENMLGFVLMEVRDDLIHGRDSIWTE